MNFVPTIFAAHPTRALHQIAGLDQLLDALADCALSTTACADACLAEPDPSLLRRCVRLNLDCSDLCGATARILARGTEPDWRIVRAQLQACLTACVVCAEECERHAKMHVHCRQCAEACRACERACQQALAKVPAMAMA